MISMVNLNTTRERSSDALELRAYLQQLVGQPLLFIRFSYGDELTLHFGQPLKYKSSKLANLSRGSYIIGARASFWLLRTHVPAAVVIGTSSASRLWSKHKSLTPEDVEESDFLRPGTRIVTADPFALTTGTRSPYGFGLSLLLEHGASLLVIPSRPSRRNHRRHRVADWEVFTPYDRYLAAGPGLFWSYRLSRTVDPKNAQQE